MVRIRRLTERLATLRADATADHEDDAWVMTCPCGTNVSMWDLGGLRLRASERGLQRSMECPSCRQRFVGRAHRVTV